MKKLFFLAFLALSVGCGSDDDEASQTDLDLLAGEWEFELSLVMCEDGSVFESRDSLDPCESLGTVIAFSIVSNPESPLTDGVYETRYFEWNRDYEECEVKTGGGTFSLEDDILILDDEAFHVFKLTDKILEFGELYGPDDYVEEEPLCDRVSGGFGRFVKK